MTNQERLAEQMKTLPPEEVYDLLYNVFVGIGLRYNNSRGGVAMWLREEVTE